MKKNDLREIRDEIIALYNNGKSVEDLCVQYDAIWSDIYDASCHNGGTKVLSFSGKNQTKHLLDWFYNDAQLYIQRKFNLYYDRFIVA